MSNDDIIDSVKEMLMKQLSDKNRLTRSGFSSPATKPSWNNIVCIFTPSKRVLAGDTISLFFSLISQTANVLRDAGYEIEIKFVPQKDETFLCTITIRKKVKRELEDELVDPID